MRSFINSKIYEESINVDTINKLIYSLHNLLKGYSEKWHLGYFYGFFEIQDLERKFSLAYDYLVNLENQKLRLQLDSCCICKEDLGILMESVRVLVGSCSSLRIDLIEDNSNLDNWILSNPDRVAREIWEKCLYAKCDKPTYLLVRDLNSKDCTLIYNLVKTIKDCNLSFNLKKQTTDCDLAYNLMRETTDCTLTYDEFVTFHNCGGTVDLIKTIRNCGVDIEVDLTHKCIDLTYNLKKYSICQNE